MLQERLQKLTLKKTLKTKYKFIDDKNTGCLIFPRRIIIETPVGRHIVKGQLVSLGHYHFNGEGKLLTQAYIYNIPGGRKHVRKK
jgi:hypothetical protein